MAFGLRLFGIGSPVAFWREADTAAMTRNFHENGYALAYPQIDWGGEAPGYVESEFPVYPFVVALVYPLLGEVELAGRLLSVVFWMGSLVFLFLLVRGLIDEQTALWASLYHALLPLNLIFSRALMPEPLLILSLVAGVFFYSRWLDTEHARHFFCACLFISLAVLVKLPSLYIGLPLLYLSWLKYGGRLLRQPVLWLFALLVLAPALGWYYHAHRIYEVSGLSFGIWDYGSGKWGNWELVISVDYWRKILLHSLADKHFALLGFPLFAVGLFLRRRTAKERMFDFWLLALVVYLIVAGSGNLHHEYYQLPVMLPAVVFIGKVYARYMTANVLRDPVSLALALSIVVVAGISLARYHSAMIRDASSATGRQELAEALRSRSEKHDLILFVQPNHDPTSLYVCRRRGWVAMAGEIDEFFLMDKIHRGAAYIVGAPSIIDGLRNVLDLQSPKVSFERRFESEDYVVLGVRRE